MTFGVLLNQNVKPEFNFFLLGLIFITICNLSCISTYKSDFQIFIILEFEIRSYEQKVYLDLLKVFPEGGSI